jgi:ferredoxin-NADP reductase
MKTLHVFLAVAAMIAGAILLLSVPYNGFFWDHAAEAFIGVVLLAGGLTYFWKRSFVA